jgi:hypothetical protein
MQINEWVLESLRNKGISINSDGSLVVCFNGRKPQVVEDITTAIRQQEHIIQQQELEQRENVEIGLLMNEFRDIVLHLSKMTVEELGCNIKTVYMSELTEILHYMSKKTETIRKDGFNRLVKVYKMLEKNNLPAANLASQAALDRMRKRWKINQKVIEKSFARLQTLKSLNG